MKRLSGTLALAVAITGFTMLLPRDGCVCGPVRGFPFPAIRPICSVHSRFYLTLDNKPKSTQTVLHYPGLLVNTAFYFGIVLLMQYVLWKDGS